MVALSPSLRLDAPQPPASASIDAKRPPAGCGPKMPMFHEEPGPPAVTRAGIAGARARIVKSIASAGASP
jgi:hypothetical protein